MTLAEKFAEKMNNDGQNWDGFEDVMSQFFVYDSKRGGFSDASRYEFTDGSAIVTSGDGWDLGYPDRPGCYCWPEAMTRQGTHNESCQYHEETERDEAKM